jgi:hypothetical protein
MGYDVYIIDKHTHTHIYIYIHIYKHGNGGKNGVVKRNREQGNRETGKRETGKRGNRDFRKGTGNGEKERDR